jgi:hypothetical protein
MNRGQFKQIHAKADDQAQYATIWVPAVPMRGIAIPAAAWNGSAIKIQELFFDLDRFGKKDLCFQENMLGQVAVHFL